MRIIITLSFLMVFIALSCKKNVITVHEEHEDPAIPWNPDPYPDPDPIIDYDTIFIVNNTGDTIYPSDYLMAYPGSWWKYSNGHEYKCTGWDEVTFYQKMVTGNTVTITTENHILPKLSNVGYIMNQSHIFTSNFNTSSVKIIGDFVGEQIYFSQTSQGSYPNSSTNTQTNVYATHHDEITINGQLLLDVMEIQETCNIVYTYPGGGPSLYITKYYAKNIGLVKVVSEGPYSNLINMEITNYHIAPH